MNIQPLSYSLHGRQLDPFLMAMLLVCSSTAFSMPPRVDQSSSGSSISIVIPPAVTDQDINSLEGRLGRVQRMAAAFSGQQLEPNSDEYGKSLEAIVFSIKEIVEISNSYMAYFNQITENCKAEIMASKLHAKKGGKENRFAMILSYDQKMKNHPRLVAVRTQTKELMEALPSGVMTRSTLLPNGTVVPEGDPRDIAPTMARAERRTMNRVVIETGEVAQMEGNRFLATVSRSHSAALAIEREQEAEVKRRTEEVRQQAKVATLLARRKRHQQERKQEQERQLQRLQEQASSPEYLQARLLAEQARLEAARAFELLEQEKQAARELEYRNWRKALRELAEARDSSQAPMAAAAASASASSGPGTPPILFQWDTRARNEFARLKDAEAKNAIIHLIADIEEDASFSSSKDSKPIEGVDNLFELRPMGGTHACRPLYTHIGGNIFMILTLGGKNNFSNDIKRAQSRMLQFYEVADISD